MPLPFDLHSSLMENHAAGLAFAAGYTGARLPLSPPRLFVALGSDVLMLSPLAQGGQSEEWQASVLPAPESGATPLRLLSRPDANGQWINLACVGLSPTHDDAPALFATTIDPAGNCSGWQCAGVVPNDPSHLPHDQILLALGEVSTGNLTYLAAGSASQSGQVVLSVCQFTGGISGYGSQTLPQSGPPTSIAIASEDTEIDAAAYFTAGTGTAAAAYRCKAGNVQPFDLPDGLSSPVCVAAIRSAANERHLFVGGTGGICHVPAASADATLLAMPGKTIVEVASVLNQDFSKIWWRGGVTDHDVGVATLFQDQTWRGAWRFASDVDRVVVLSAPTGNPDLVTLDASGLMVHHWTEAAHGLRVSTPIAIRPPTGQTTKTVTLKTYNVQLSLDPRQMAQNPQVTIGVSLDCRLQVNGAYYHLSPANSLSIAMPKTGTLDICGVMNSWSTPLLRLEGDFDGQGLAGYDIHSSGEIQDRLSRTSADDLKALDKDIDPQTAQAAAVAVSSLSQYLKPKGSGMANRGRLGGTVSRCEAGSAIDNGIGGNGPPLYFNMRAGQIAASNDQAAVDAQIARIIAGGGQIGSLFSDLLDAVECAFEFLTDFVITKVENGIRILLATVDGYIDTVVTTLEQGWAVVSRILDAIKLYLELTFPWLAFVFEWAAISSTTRVLSHALDLMFEQLAAGGQHAGFGSIDLQTAIANIMQGRPTTLPDWRGGYNTGQGDRMRNEAGSATPRGNWASSKLRGGVLQDAVGPAHAKTSLLRTSLRGDEIFGEASRKLLDDLSKLARDAMATLLSFDFGPLMADLNAGLFDDTLLVLQEVGQKLLDQAGTVVEQGRDALTGEWDIPILTDLFEKAVGEKPSLSNLLLLAFCAEVVPCYNMWASALGGPDKPFNDAQESALLATTSLSDFAATLRSFMAAERDAENGVGWVSLFLGVLLGTLTGGVYVANTIRSLASEGEGEADADAQAVRGLSPKELGNVLLFVSLILQLTVLGFGVGFAIDDMGKREDKKWIPETQMIMLLVAGLAKLFAVFWASQAKAPRATASGGESEGVGESIAVEITDIVAGGVMAVASLVFAVADDEEHLVDHLAEMDVNLADATFGALTFDPAELAETIWPAVVVGVIGVVGEATPHLVRAFGQETAAA